MIRVTVPFSLAAFAFASFAMTSPAKLHAQEAVAATLGGAPLLPLNARPGECYTRVYVPASYETSTEDVLIKEAAETIEVTPPEFETVEEQVLIKEESEMIEVVPASFKEVEEQVLIKPESEELVVVPAEYEEVDEQVLVRPASATWQTNCGPIEKVSKTTGETLCLVEVPAEYETLTKRVLKSPARTEVKKIPAEYKTVTKMVVDEPATTRTLSVPAEHMTVKVQKQIAPADELRTPIPEEYKTVTKTAKTGAERVEWRQILCENNVTRDMVRQIQAALQDERLYKGPLDGDIGPGTMAAIIAFQKREGLPAGQLTIETMKALNLQL